MEAIVEFCQPVADKQGFELPQSPSRHPEIAVTCSAKFFAGELWVKNNLLVKMLNPLVGEVVLCQGKPERVATNPKGGPIHRIHHGESVQGPYTPSLNLAK